MPLIGYATSGEPAPSAAETLPVCRQLRRLGRTPAPVRAGVEAEVVMPAIDAADMPAGA